MFGLWKSTSGDFYNLLETGELSDTEILIGEEPDTKIFKVHSLILKTRSKYFRTAFSNNWIKTENNTITLHKPNISAEVFDILIKANDFITIQQETLLEFLTEYNQRLNPMEIWDKLIEWSIGQYNELPKNTKEWTNNDMSIFGTLINPFITFIDFEKISLTNFCNNIKPFKDIFDKEFYVQMLEYYSFNEDSHSKFKLDIDSKIITPFHAFLIGNFIKLSNGIQNCTFEFQLLVRGSRDGFNVKNFHKNCDEKGPTITIANVKNSNEIVGGYNPLDWNPNFGTDFVSDEYFIFSLDKKDLEKFIFSKFVVENLGVYKNNGPDFGGNTSDLRLLEGDAKKGQCYKNSYEKLIRKVEGVFDIEDYEVFQVSTINHWEFDDEIEVEISEYNEYEYYDDPDYRGYLYDF
ncbi:hypothetical protein RirG_051290 [Rhizophagus irregularis DAOM 197198w]|uniref:BTB-domain-containing protein n=1 Tax=Rhizophagus irregularis (strain DAOM 197198w) TaxID=1432141 RepID=A0A015LNX2_RHIIW|nr:hypothetical protein RirG_051290 [Rhizophagus irregularis DAOM 197198w]